ncbi:hypothetical protein [Mucilaginibacter rubeus]|uniref:Uncharacterized protein n=1 Tax=Mucilaginibacter rubeus TaxID=2027860 RepID=A0A5C1HVK2_9SPHI|nr:hypothetical protein [Mucilaginibacter rubeus]QEM09091.1 hypothetical protein DEO27_003355 [Mucilaginibacter rubeus]
MIVRNIHAYDKGLEFGFTAVELDQYGWLKSPQLVDMERIDLGDTSHFNRYSMVKLGRGLNGVWRNAVGCNYGIAGSYSPLCVFGKQFGSRDAALSDALNRLKAMMTKKIGHSDTSNYHQDVIRKALEAIAKYEVGQVQLTLF